MIEKQGHFWIEEPVLHWHYFSEREINEGIVFQTDKPSNQWNIFINLEDKKAFLKGIYWDNPYVEKEIELINNFLEKKQKNIEKKKETMETKHEEIITTFNKEEPVIKNVEDDLQVVYFKNTFYVIFWLVIITLIFKTIKKIVWKKQLKSI